MSDSKPTGTSDSNYDLILVLQQALEDCTRYQAFREDSRRAGDDELADFFDELATSDHEIAERAKRLLAARL
jgi:rubrerythrin